MITVSINGDTTPAYIESRALHFSLSTLSAPEKHTAVPGIAGSHVAPSLADSQ
jgi:hypothetical protein